MAHTRLAFAEKTITEPQRFKLKSKHINDWKSVRLLLEPSQMNWWEDPDVVVAFNFPRISGRLERLMGTNIVRLTDRKYMKELRSRIEEDYRKQLERRISARELKEIERERLLIIEGKTDVIPDELSDDPIFVVNKCANLEIQKQRSKLKTNRERNSERLKQQGEKWERERLQHQEEERIRLEGLRERRKQQKELEERYMAEDAVRGMDLLRIDNEDWRECEQELKEFLEYERAKMKEKSMRVPTPFSSDPRDIQNIVRARKKFRETEHRIRQQLNQLLKEEGIMATPELALAAKSEASRISKILVTDGMSAAESFAQLRATLTSGATPEELAMTEDDDHLPEPQEMLEPQKRDSDEYSIVGGIELPEEESTISESRMKHAAQLDEEIDADVQKGLLISRDQYEHLRYEDDKILQLRNVESIRHMYQLAEEIIVGERYEEIVEEEGEGEFEEEEGDDAEDKK